MADVKLVVIYPRPKDVDAFEKIYQPEHVPLAVAKLGGKIKIVATKIKDTGLPTRTSCFPPDRKSLLSLDARSGNVRGFGGLKRNTG